MILFHVDILTWKLISPCGDSRGAHVP